MSHLIVRLKSILKNILKAIIQKGLGLLPRNNKIWVSGSRFGQYYINYIESQKLKSIHNHYKNLVKRLRLKNLRGKKVKVLFFVSQNQLWCVDSVYSELSKNLSFEPGVVVFSNGEDRVKAAGMTCKENYEFFQSRNMNVVYGYDIERSRFLDLADLDPDIVFYDQPVPFLQDYEKRQKYKVINNNIDPLTSMDYCGEEFSVIVDHRWTKVENGRHLKLVYWYDNEWGYSSRVVDLLKAMSHAQRDLSSHFDRERELTVEA